MFTAQQVQAIRQLETAFAKCHQVGLVFQAMDTNILAFSAEELKAAEKESTSRYAAMELLLADGRSLTVHAESFLDSGGW